MYETAAIPLLLILPCYKHRICKCDLDEGIFVEEVFRSDFESDATCGSLRIKGSLSGSLNQKRVKKKGRPQEEEKHDDDRKQRKS